MRRGALDRPPSLSDAVVSHIRSAIIRGTYAPGRSLTEKALADELGTSRGTVREALRELAGLGLVTRTPNRGVTVPTLTAVDAEELLTLRAELEAYAARLAISRGRLDDAALADLAGQVDAIGEAAAAGDVPGMVEADVGFHARLSALSGHALLLEHLTTIQHQSQWLLFYCRPYRPAAGVVVESHRQLLDVLRGGDPTAVAVAIHDHIFRLGTDMIARMAERESPLHDTPHAGSNSKEPR